MGHRVTAPNCTGGVRIERAPRAAGSSACVGILRIGVAELASNPRFLRGEWESSGARDASWRAKVPPTAAPVDRVVLFAPGPTGPFTSVGLGCILVAHHTLAARAADPPCRIDGERE